MTPAKQLQRCVSDRRLPLTVDLTVPALLFPAISLLFLAYTNRFLSLANLIRQLHGRYGASPDESVLAQLQNLGVRVRLIRLMQELGVISLLLCVLSMFALFADSQGFGKATFGLSLLMLMASLAVSAWEIHISVHALKLQLRDLADASPLERRGGR